MWVKTHMGGSFSFINHLGPGYQIQVVRFNGRHLYLLNQPISSLLLLFSSVLAVVVFCTHPTRTDL